MLLLECLLHLALHQQEAEEAERDRVLRWPAHEDVNAQAPHRVQEWVVQVAASSRLCVWGCLAAWLQPLDVGPKQMGNRNRLAKWSRVSAALGEGGLRDEFLSSAGYQVSS